MEPLRLREVTDDPGEVDLGQTSGLRVVEVVETVPDGLQNAVLRLVSVWWRAKGRGLTKRRA